MLGERSERQISPNGRRGPKGASPKKGKNVSRMNNPSNKYGNPQVGESAPPGNDLSMLITTTVVRNNSYHSDKKYKDRLS